MRIWVTGIGVVSPLGRGADVTMDGMLRGERGIGSLSLFALDGLRSGIAAEVRGLTAAEVAPPGEDEGWSRTDAMSVIAVREALTQAKVSPFDASIDLALGGTTAGMFETEDVLASLSRDPNAIAPLGRVLSHPLSSTADHVRAAVGPFRRVRSICSACSSGANAILLGATWLRHGRSTCVVAGGADGLCRLTYCGFGALSALDVNLCRPFDARRQGLNLGEGAAFLVLEPAHLAKARGAEPIAELAGFAVGAEAHHITNPEASGASAARVMRDALAVAGLTARDLDYVNAHGTATPLNDSMEARALEACLGEEVGRVAVSSTKGSIGHTLAAAGAIEAAVAALSIARSVIPPTVGLEEIDPACAKLNHVVEARRQKVRAAMSNSFGFGGTDAVLVFTEPERFAAPKLDAARAVVVTGAASVGPLGVAGVAASADYLEAGPAPDPGGLAFNAADYLDVARARRLDRAGRLTTVAIATAQAEAKLALEGATSLHAGAIFGASFGNVDGSTAFMRRIYDKGARYASPADFPNLVPSSPVGHASIYLGLRGPVVAMADLGVTAESAISTAAELVEAGLGEAIFAGSTEEASPMIERCLGPICSKITDAGVRGEGASALLLESASSAEKRGAHALARLAWWWSSRTPSDGKIVLPSDAPAPSARSVVLVGRESEVDAGVLDGSAWAKIERRALAPRTGNHEGAGGFAAAAAAALIAAGACDSVLVVGTAPDRASALLFTSP